MGLILGLDLSLRSTGWCLLAVNGDCAHASISVKPGIVGAARLWRIWHELQERLALNEAIRLVVLEGYAYGAGAAGHVFQLGELGGVARLWVQEHTWPHIVVPPNVLKKFVTSKGTATKVEMGTGVEARWGKSFLRPLPKKIAPGDICGWGTKDDHWYNDEADAYALARFGEAYLDEQVFFSLPRSQQELVRDVRLDPEGVLSAAKRRKLREEGGL
jgi:Holliday junction resolvasome RuvABC endonuclease subunit